MIDRLADHRDVWRNKRILREAYLEWYNALLRDRSMVDGPMIELGGGGGNFKDFFPDAVTTDVLFSSWLDVCCDAHELPFKGGSIANIVMIDVLHHLADPVGFLRTAWTLLRPGGRVLMVEPYPSPFSRIVYKLVHPEPFFFDVDYFRVGKTRTKDPWDSNQAIPYLLFFRHVERFVAEFRNQFRFVQRRRMSMLLYPASGGFENRALVPEMLVPVLKAGERALAPLSSLLAFRCYVVLEKFSQVRTGTLS